MISRRRWLSIISNRNAIGTSRAKGYPFRPFNSSTLLRKVAAAAVGLSITTVVLTGLIHREAEVKDDGLLEVRRYKSFQLVSREAIDHQTSLFKIKINGLNSRSDHEDDEDQQVEKPLEIQRVYIKHPDLMIERAYTPLSKISKGSDLLELIIKRYDDGEMSEYLFERVKPGGTVEVRGPVVGWSSSGSRTTATSLSVDLNTREDRVLMDDYGWGVGDGRIRKIVFIAAGTGITPAIQLLRQIYDPTRTISKGSSPASRMTRFSLSLMFVNRRVESIYLADELMGLQSSNPQLLQKLRFVISHDHPQEPGQILSGGSSSSLYCQGDDGDWRVTYERFKVEMLEELFDDFDLTREGGGLIFVCGPERFVRYLVHEIEMRRRREAGGVDQPTGKCADSLDDTGLSSLVVFES
ncbi:expressed protein [Phakopsora pachyrhizi]|uniref:Expressed protein n=1 Tax=Phakopsora pachyrhizi TaxID=170000 RepID=A0AAV0BUE9_PHAPC|nr:expressed protein [Phakopsora pachyrhizi]